MDYLWHRWPKFRLRLVIPKMQRKILLLFEEFTNLLNLWEKEKGNLSCTNISLAWKENEPVHRGQWYQRIEILTSEGIAHAMQGQPFFPMNQCHAVAGWPIGPNIVLIWVSNCKEVKKYDSLTSYDMEITLINNTSKWWIKRLQQ